MEIGVDLKQICNVKIKNKEIWTDNELIGITSSILDTIIDMHYNKIAHCDIKESNIIFSS